MEWLKRQESELGCVRSLSPRNQDSALGQMPLERTNNRKGKKGKSQSAPWPALRSPRTLSSVFALLLKERVEDDASVQVITASWWAICLAVWTPLNHIPLMWAARESRRKLKTLQVGILWWSWLCHRGVLSWLLRFPSETLPYPSLPLCQARLSCYGIDVLCVQLHSS